PAGGRLATLAQPRRRLPRTRRSGLQLRRAPFPQGPRHHLHECPRRPRQCRQSLRRQRFPGDLDCQPLRPARRRARDRPPDTGADRPRPKPGPPSMSSRVAVLLLLALLLAAPASASERHPTLAELEHEVMCPTCKPLLELSEAPVAERMRSFIRQRIAAGDTKSEIKARLVAQFGAGVLAAPQTSGFGLLAWLLPFLGLLGAGISIGLVTWRWTRAGQA